jgi:large subunit ribosomal protein L17
MRHRNGYRKLNKATDQRMAMLRSIAGETLKHGAVKVTEMRGKEARRVVEKVVELAKKGDLHSRRKALSIIPNRDAVGKIFSEAKTRYANRSGGYTRLVKIGFRRGDATPMVMLELV